MIQNIPNAKHGTIKMLGELLYAASKAEGSRSCDDAAR
jgi:hypothetical protein